MIRTLTVVIADGTVPAGTVPPAVPTEQPIAVARGEDQVIRLNVIHADFRPFDIAGCGIRLAVRRWLADESAMFTRVASQVGLSTAGTAQVVIPSIDTLGLTEKRRYWYDVEVTDVAGHRWQGVLVSGYHINPIVSQPNEPILPPLVDTGAPIAIGPPGPAGVDGLSILNGIGVPASGLGRDGEWYIDRTVPTALVMYGPKTAGAWGAGRPFGGGGGGGVISTSDPLPGALVADPGSGPEVSAWDHVHPYTLAVASGADGWMSGAMAQQLADLVAANYGAAISTVAGNLAALTTTVSGHTSTLASHTSSIAANAGAISTLQAITLIPGAGLTGGGDLSGPNRTFNVGQNADGSITVNADDIQVSAALQSAISTNTSNIASLTATVAGISASFVPSTRTITPGAGLVGSAALDLSADRTLAVGANVDASITVNANDIQLSTTLQTAISANTSNISSLTTTVGSHTTMLGAASFIVRGATNAPANAQILNDIGTGYVRNTLTTEGADDEFHVGRLSTVATIPYTDVTGGPSTSAKFLVQVAHASIPSAQAMGALGTGLVKNTTTTGVQSIAVANTDFADPGATYVVQTAANAPGSAQVLGSLATGVLLSTTSTGVLSIAGAADIPSLLTTKGDLLGFSTVPARVAVAATDGWVLTVDAASTPGWKWAAVPARAPTTSTYLLQVADAALPSAQAMGALATGLVKNTTTTGVQSIAVANTDYAHPSATYIVQTSSNAPGSAQVLGSLSTGVLKVTTTTGVLSVAAAADIPSLLTTKGDLLGYSTLPLRVPIAVTDGWVLTVDAASAPGWKWAVLPSRAPTTSTYLLQTADGALPNAQAMGALATGLVKNTTTTGVQSIAVANTDFAHPSATYIVQTSSNAPSNAQVLASLGTGIVKVTTSTGVLSVAAAADIPSLLTTKGDLLGFSTLPVRVGVGTDTWVVTADAASAAGWKWAAQTGGGVTAHSALTGLTGSDDHTQYALLAGRAGGQTFTGGTASGEGLTLASTSHSTKGTVQIGATAQALFNLNLTVASATSAVLDAVKFPANTVAVTGSTAVTTATGFNYLSVETPTITDSSAVTISDAATMTIAGAPTAAGSVTITRGYALWVRAGAARFDGNVGLGTSPAVDLDITKTVSGGGVAAQVSNLSNTASSSATITAQVGGASAGNPSLVLGITGGLIWNVQATNATHDRFDVLKGSTRMFTIDPSAASAVAQFYFDPAGAGTNALCFSDANALAPNATGVAVSCSPLGSNGRLQLTGDIFGTAGKGISLYMWTGANYRDGLTLDNRVGQPILQLVRVGGQVTSLGTNSLASASGLVWDGRDYQASTLTLTGSTNVTTATGLNYVDIKTPTITSASPITVSFAAALHIAAAPVAAGSTTITKAYSLWIDSGLPRIDSSTANGSVATVLGSVGPTGANTTVQEWLTVDVNGNTRYLACF